MLLFSWLSNERFERTFNKIRDRISKLDIEFLIELVTHHYVKKQYFRLAFSQINENQN